MITVAKSTAHAAAEAASGEMSTAKPATAAAHMAATAAAEAADATMSGGQGRGRHRRTERQGGEEWSRVACDGFTLAVLKKLHGICLSCLRCETNDDTPNKNRFRLHSVLKGIQQWMACSTEPTDHFLESR